MNRLMTLPLFLAWVASLGCAHAQDRPRGLQGRDSPLRVVEPDAEDVVLRTTPVVRAVRKAADSVVSVYIVQRDRMGRPQPQGQGSGVILDDSGFVITNWHVVAAVLKGSNGAVLVKLKDGRERGAKVLSSSPQHDLALLQLALEPGEKVAPVEIGSSAELMMGESVVAIGNPQGHSNTVTSGVLSAADRSIQVMTPDGPREYSGLLQTDAAINQGNSGGALLDITGKLIGINNAMSVSAENIGFAIPVDTVRKVFEDELISSESLAASNTAVWLGMRIAQRDGAVVVTEVMPQGPAATAGLREGDRLLRIGDAVVRSPLDYARRVLTAPSGQPLLLQVARGGNELQVRPIPLSRAQGLLIAMVGLEVEEVSAAEDRETLRDATLRFYRGTPYRSVPMLPAILKVTRVHPGGPAAALGLESGDYILGVMRENRWREDVEVPVASASDLIDNHLRPLAGRYVTVLVMRGKQELTGDLEIRQPKRDV